MKSPTYKATLTHCFSQYACPDKIEVFSDDTYTLKLRALNNDVANVYLESGDANHILNDFDVTPLSLAVIEKDNIGDFELAAKSELPNNSGLVNVFGNGEVMVTFTLIYSAGGDE